MLSVILFIYLFFNCKPELNNLIVFLFVYLYLVSLYEIFVHCCEYLFCFINLNIQLICILIILMYNHKNFYFIFVAFVRWQRLFIIIQIKCSGIK